MMGLTNYELQLISNLLSEASEIYANHTCNDYPLPNTPENYALMRDLYVRNGDLDEFEDEVDPNADELYFWDWGLMHYFADRIKEEIDG